MNFRLTCFVLLNVVLAFSSLGQTPVRVAIAGISHGHASWIFNRKDKTDLEVVGIWEKDTTLANRFKVRYHLPAGIFFTDLNEMLAKAKPAAVTAFGPIDEHLEVVKAAAPRKILATTFEDAKHIARLANENKIKVLTNFETSWYASNAYLFDLHQQGALGDIRRIIVNDGHSGPYGMSKEFVDWLTDPVKNGAGALFDFGCYGANLSTWLLRGQRPISVTAVTHQNRPDRYPKVDDDATIILQYPTAQCVIQPSWSWTFSRKDMEVYGTKGYAIAVDRTTVKSKLDAKSSEQTLRLPELPAPFGDPFSVLADVVSGRLTMDMLDRYELPVNLITVEILDAARKSAQSGKTIMLD
jgi:predicted dehydrogenase